MTKTILVVDNEEDIRISVKEILEKNGYKTIIAINGDDCLEKLKKNKVDLILLDIMMPGTPVKEIIPKIEDTKIIFLSVVRTSESEKEKLLKNKNIIDYIQKPFDIDNLLNHVKKALK
jgi:DNA-binding response OmpR family regulator